MAELIFILFLFELIYGGLVQEGWEQEEKKRKAWRKRVTLILKARDQTGQAIERARALVGKLPYLHRVADAIFRILQNKPLLEGTDLVKHRELMIGALEEIGARPRGYRILWEDSLTGLRGCGNPLPIDLARAGVLFGNRHFPLIRHWVCGLPELIKTTKET